MVGEWGDGMSFLARHVNGILFLLFLVGMATLSHINYLLFHLIAETFSIVIAAGIFMFAWNSRRILENHYLIFLGISCAYVAGIDLVHTAAYSGMGIFPQHDSNLPTQLWIIARYIQALSFLAAPFFLGRSLRLFGIFASYGVITSVLLILVFEGKFPDCYVEGEGLTTFKTVSEYLISLIYLGAAFLLIRDRRYFSSNVLHWLLASLGAAIVSELAFTLYIDVYGIFNAAGHLLKIVSFYLIYKAVIETGLTKPFELLFRDLKQSEKNYQELVQKTRSLILRLDSEGKITFVNEYALKFFGYSREELIGKPAVGTILPFRDSWNQDLGEMLEKILKNPHEFYRNENENILKDGRRVWIAWSNEPLMDELGHFRELLCVGADITELRQARDVLQHTNEELERRVQERTAELVRSNEELQQFAYISSHDLQEPLRMISLYVKQLELKYKDQLDEMANEYIHFAVEGATRMHAMVKNILEYSQIRAEGREFEPVDMSKVLAQALQNLKVPLETTQAKVSYDPLPVVMGDRLQLVRVLENLLDNALKFRSQKTPEIHLSASQSESEWIFSVRDNGIGIAREYQERIFKIFKRLHTRERYPGTGIGLSLVKRIVERHGGRVYVESTLGEGSTFYFTIPIRENEPAREARNPGGFIRDRS